MYVAGFADREALTFAAGHRVLFCCVLDRDTPLPRATVESLGAHLATGTVPDFDRPAPAHAGMEEALFRLERHEEALRALGRTGRCSA